MSLKLARIAPETGAVTSYSTCLGRFIISHLSRHKQAQKDSWQVTDLQNFGFARTWTLREAREIVRKITTPSENFERFLVLSRLGEMDAVLYDRRTGEWWYRKMDAQLAADIELLKTCF